MIIRWSRLIPRLLILAVLLVSAWFMQDGLIRWQLKSNIESQTGASAEIGAVRADLHGGKITIDDLRLFDPKLPERSLFQAEKIVAQADSGDLMRRYFHFPQIDAEGIRIHVEGVEGQELVPDKIWLKMKDRLPKEFASAGEFDWTMLLTEKPEIAALNLLKQFETSKLSEDLKKRWPEELKQFETASSTIRGRFQEIKTLFEQAETPEEKLRVVGRILEELEKTDDGIQQLFLQVTKLKSQAEGDYQALFAATKRDQASLKTIRAPSIDTEALSETLIGPDIKEQWDKTVAWGDWVLTLLVPQEQEDGLAVIHERFGLTPPQKVRGEMIHFASQKARAELLIDRMNLTGQIQFGTLPVYFNGAVRNVAQSMNLGEDPMLAQFCFSGSGIPASPVLPQDDEMAAAQLAAVVDSNILPNLYVVLSVDRIGLNEEDQLIVRCPLYRLPERILGDPEKWAVAVSPGNSSLDGVLILQGEKLSGQFKLVQDEIRMNVLLPEKLRGSSLHRVLQQTLDSLDSLTAEVSVGGTRSEPTYAFKSNIGEKLRPQIENLVREEWAEVRTKAEAALTGEANEAVAALNAAIQEKINPVVGELNSLRTQWEQQLVQGDGIPLDRLVQGQLSNLSEKDRERFDRFMKTPTVQTLLQAQKPADGSPNDQIDQTIQRGVDKLQDKLPGLLDRLKR